MGLLGFPEEGDSKEGGKIFLGSCLPQRKWHCLHVLLGSRLWVISTASTFLCAAYQGTSSKVPPHAGHRHKHTVQGASGPLIFKGAGPSAQRTSHVVYSQTPYVDVSKLGTFILLGQRRWHQTLILNCFPSFSSWSDILKYGIKRCLYPISTTMCLEVTLKCWLFSAVTFSFF